MPDELAGQRHLSIPAFLAIVVGYLAVLKGMGFALSDRADLDDGKLLTTRQALLALAIPIGASLVYALVVVVVLGWGRPVFRDDVPVQRWVWIVPIVLAVGIVAAINYPELGDKGLGFTLALLLGTQCVGWAEETMFRGIGVTALRRNGLAEGKVALWSSVIFGAVHLSNLIGGGAGAVAQAAFVSFAGYFFYLVRRVSHGNALNSVLHGLFDFSVISGTGIAADGEGYPGAIAAILVYVVLAVVLVIRRHRIEPAAS